MTDNVPGLWLPDFPRPRSQGHKYDRGHAVIYGGTEKTGAARLAARGCARIGAGLTTIVAPPGKGDLYRMEMAPHLMVSEVPFADFIQNEKVTAVCIGPGAGSDIADATLKVLSGKKPCVLDADALTVFKEDPGRLFAALHEGAVLTPHEGEFRRLFGEIDARQAADKARCVVVLKGARTHIAAPGMNVVVNQADAPYLATAGTGDVLAGMITGLLAQGMDPYKAACAAVWIHGEAGKSGGAGLVASDLPDMMPAVLKRVGL